RAREIGDRGQTEIRRLRQLGQARGRAQARAHRRARAAKPVQDGLPRRVDVEPVLEGRESRAAHRYGRHARHEAEPRSARDQGARAPRSQEVAQGIALAVARLAARDVKKTFGSTVALAGVTFAVEAGQVHALVGENGAGKSTLMNVLAGATSPDSGELLLDGAPYRPAGPDDARKSGVAMVHQELSLCPHLDVTENIALGTEPTKLGFVRRAEMRRIAEAALARVSDPAERGNLSPDARVGDLSPASQQLVEIARALSQSRCR